MTLAQNWWISFVSAMDGLTVATQQYYTGSVVDKAFEGTLAGKRPLLLVVVVVITREAGEGSGNNLTTE